MRGRLVIAAAALTMALTPGVASATQDGDDQTTGSYSAEATMSQGSEGTMSQGAEGAMAQSAEGTESQGSEATDSQGSGATDSQGSGATDSQGSGATGSQGSGAAGSQSDATASQEAPRPGEGVPGYEVVTLPNENVPNFQRRTVYCPPGKKAIGGGAEARGDTAILVGSFPTNDARGWIGLGRQTSTDNVGISVFAICANV
ncbi:hypothetical protein ACIQPP_41795 [Streptomyces violaceusniger]|uniref:hypothetical protein n=1 Tax=Streptomyces violaceusniger TaxID=68280 RepID=UPI0009C2150F|nr:hypothetical protein [Streptomyces hygroscopicus]AQW52294.1 hypothetical protein SHXM_05757 [Streptomyces hygroscopicus]